MMQVVTIGQFEFVAAPGQLIRRKKAQSWYLGAIIMVIALLPLFAHSYYHAAGWFAYGSLLLYFALADKPEKRDSTPLMERRDGRWIIRENDTAPIAGAEAILRQDGDRWLVSLTWPNNKGRPILIWWTKKQADADKLWELVGNVLANETEEAWRLTPAANGAP